MWKTTNYCYELFIFCWHFTFKVNFSQTDIFDEIVGRQKWSVDDFNNKE